MKKIKLIWFLVLMMLLAFACGGGDDNESVNNQEDEISEEIEVFDLEAHIAYVFDSGIIPQVELAKVSANEFKLALSNFKTTSTQENFESLKESWRNLMSTWKPLEVITYGDFSLTSQILAIHFWAIDEVLLETNIENYTIDNFEIDATARGLGALEYILFSKDYQLLVEDVNFENSIAYLDILIDDLIIEIEDFEQEWFDFEEDFKTNYSIPVTGTQNKLINQIIFTFYDILIEKIQEPLLAISEDPEFLNTETPYSEYSLQIILAQVEFMENLFSGTLTATNASLSIYEQLNILERGDLVEALQNQFEVTLSSLSSSSKTLEELIVENSDELSIIREDLTALQVLISTDVVSALDLTVLVSDNDGD